MCLYYCFIFADQEFLFPEWIKMEINGKLTRKGLLGTIGPAIPCPKGVTTGLAGPKAGNPPPETHTVCRSPSLKRCDNYSDWCVGKFQRHIMLLIYS